MTWHFFRSCLKINKNGAYILFLPFIFLTRIFWHYFLFFSEKIVQLSAGHLGADNCAPRTIGRRRTIWRRHLGAEWQLGAEKRTIGRRSEILKNVIKNYNLKCEILMSFNFICDNINFRICNIFIFIFRQMAYILILTYELL